LVEKEKGDS
jgi:hypothetical protein